MANRWQRKNVRKNEREIHLPLGKGYTVGTESIQTPLNFSLFVILQPFAEII